MAHDDDSRGPHRWYPSELRHVPFPTDRAAAAKEACERVAGLLNEHLLARPGMVSALRATWQGRYRDDFDETWATYEDDLTGIKDALYLLAGTIGTASGNAAFINGQRAAARAEYNRTHPVSHAV
jgi:uncharacterized protein YukE